MSSPSGYNPVRAVIEKVLDSASAADLKPKVESLMEQFADTKNAAYLLNAVRAVSKSVKAVVSDAEVEAAHDWGIDNTRYAPSQLLAAT